MKKHLPSATISRDRALVLKKQIQAFRDDILKINDECDPQKDGSAFTCSLDHADALLGRAIDDLNIKFSLADNDNEDS